VTFAWTTNVGGSALVQVSASANGVNPVTNSPFAAGSGTSHTATTGALSAGTYYYRLVMQDDCNNYQYTGESSVTVP
jgi:hypothetical protein